MIYVISCIRKVLSNVDNTCPSSDDVLPVTGAGDQQPHCQCCFVISCQYCIVFIISICVLLLELNNHYYYCYHQNQYCYYLYVYHYYQLDHAYHSHRCYVLTSYVCMYVWVCTNSPSIVCTISPTYYTTIIVQIQDTFFTTYYTTHTHTITTPNIYIYTYIYIYIYIYVLYIYIGHLYYVLTSPHTPESCGQANDS